FEVRPHGLQQHVQPGEHVWKDGVRVRLAGIENNVGKYWHDVPETCGFLKKALIKPPHAWPELDACHGELASKQSLEIGIQSGILLGVQFEFLRDGDGVCGGVPIGEKGAGRLQAHLMCDYPQAALVRHKSGSRLRKELTIEDHNRARLSSIQKP